MTTILVRIATVILGLLYVTSGISKAMDINAFADVIVRYGIPQLRMFAPFIIGVEITLGFGLLFNVFRQRAGLLSLGLLVILTLIFALGYIFLGISDCGCFSEVITLSPLMSLLRNTLMIIMSFYIWKHPENQVSRTLIRTIVAVGLGIITFAVAGFEMKETYVEISVHEGTNLSTTFLKSLVSKNKDQLIFIFSPSCPHCQQVTPTINAYAQTKSVDEVVGIYPHLVSLASLHQYQKKAGPKFRVFAVNKESLRSVTRDLPTVLLIHKGYVRKIYIGNIPDPHKLTVSYLRFPNNCTRLDYLGYSPLPS